MSLVGPANTYCILQMYDCLNTELEKCIQYYYLRCLTWSFLKIRRLMSWVMYWKIFCILTSDNIFPDTKPSNLLTYKHCFSYMCAEQRQPGLRQESVKAKGRMNETRIKIWWWEILGFTAKSSDQSTLPFVKGSYRRGSNWLCSVATKERAYILKNM